MGSGWIPLMLASQLAFHCKAFSLLNPGPRFRRPAGMGSAMILKL